MARKNKQLEIAGLAPKPKQCFGGSLLKGNHPNGPRPLDSKRPIHLVLKSNRGVLRLPKTFNIVEDEIGHWAKLCGVTVYKHSNNGDHLHLALRVGKRNQWKRFIRGLTGSIARKLKVLGYCKNCRLWKHRPFTRIAHWQKAFKSLLNYVYLNQLEAEGNITRKHFRTFKDLQELWRDDLAA